KFQAAFGDSEEGPGDHAEPPMPWGDVRAPALLPVGWAADDPPSPAASGGSNGTWEERKEEPDPGQQDENITLSSFYGIYLSRCSRGRERERG
ncbi:unnamed protein product, partial [Caretta caretta]